jgi:hypothetical protein
MARTWLAFAISYVYAFGILLIIEGIGRRAGHHRRGIVTQRHRQPECAAPDQRLVVSNPLKLRPKGITSTA